MTRRDRIATAFLLGGLVLAFVIDVGRVSLAVCLSGALAGMYVKHGDAKAAPKGPNQASEARFLIAFAFLVVGAVVAVVLYRGWQPVAALILCAVLSMVAMRLGVRPSGESRATD